MKVFEAKIEKSFKKKREEMLYLLIVYQLEILRVIAKTYLWRFATTIQ